MHACIHACIHAYIHTYIHTYMHAYTHAYMHAYMHYMDTGHIHAYPHTYMHICMHVYIHACIRKYIHYGIQWFCNVGFWRKGSCSFQWRVGFQSESCLETSSLQDHIADIQLSFQGRGKRKAPAALYRGWTAQHGHLLVMLSLLP